MKQCNSKGSTRIGQKHNRIHCHAKKMALFFRIALVFGTFYVPVQSSDQLLYVYIDADRGNDTLECLMSNSTLKPCQTLSFVAENMTQRHYLVRIEIVSDRLDLTQPVEFKSWEGLTINGSGTIIHCNGSDAGIAFVNVRTLVIHSLIMEQCGAERDSTSFVDHHTANETEHLNVTIYILNCTDVNISHVEIQDSHGTGLSMYDTNGTVDIAYCNFSNNSVSDSDEGGGGIHIEFTICSPGIVGHCSGHNGRNHDSKYNIQNCTFSNNKANCPPDKHSHIHVSFSGGIVIPRTGKGGGLYISIGANAQFNNITIYSCTFENNTATYAGGGLLVDFLNFVQNNTVSVVNTTFTMNSCLQKDIHVDISSGGGLALGFMFYPSSWLHGEPPKGNIFQCTYCTFEQNSAYMGGGTAIIVTKQNTHDSDLSRIVFSHCNWTQNRSPMGAAVFAIPGIWGYTEQGNLPVPTFSNCIFVSNHVHQQLTLSKLLNVSSIGYGAVFSNDMKIAIVGNSWFSGNKGSAVYLLSSVLELQNRSNVTFFKNVARKGGAISMHGNSVINIGDEATVKFTQNKASFLGGAIYVKFYATLQPAYRNCFIQSISKRYADSNFIFENNTASCDVCGEDIFATTFQSCAVLCQNTSVTVPENMLQCIANFSFSKCKNSTCNNSTCKPPLVTTPQRFELHVDTTVKIIPGSEYRLPLSVYDEGNHTLTGIYYKAWVTKNPSVEIDQAFSQVSNNTIRLLGRVGDSAKLHLQEEDIELTLNVTLTDCKPGFRPYNRTCECAASDYLGLEAMCEPTLRVKHGYWVGYCDANTICTSFCPYGLCSYHGMDSKAKSHPLPNNLSQLDSQICDAHRTGRVCGRCISGHSVYFHSAKYTCGPERLCSVGWLFYILSEIVPLVLLFAVIIIFNISFTNGNVNCFIFYAQILDVVDIDAKGSIEFVSFIKNLQYVLKFIYRIFNLDFFSLEQLSFCLWKGATAIDMMIMKYATVGVALVLVVITILLCRCRCIHSHTPKRVLIQSLSAFVVLCYSQCTRVTLHILNAFCLYTANFHCKVRVVNYMGYMTYLHGDHVHYAAVAIVVLIFMVILPPLLLLLYPLVFKLLGLCKLSESKLAGILWRVIPIQLLDAFQSSFKDEFRFFAGLYFLYRAMLLGAFAYTQTVLEFYSIVQLILILVLAIHAIFQPHKEREHNIFDALLFTNLAIINSITLFNYSEVDFRGRFYSEYAINIMACVQCVLISLPFLSIIVLYIIKWRKRGKGDAEELPPLRSGESRPLIQANYS